MDDEANFDPNFSYDLSYKELRVLRKQRGCAKECAKSPSATAPIERKRTRGENEVESLAAKKSALVAEPQPAFSAGREVTKSCFLFTLIPN